MVRKLSPRSHHKHQIDECCWQDIHSVLIPLHCCWQYEETWIAFNKGLILDESPNRKKIPFYVDNINKGPVGKATKPSISIKKALILTQIKGIKGMRRIWSNVIMRKATSPRTTIKNANKGRRLLILQPLLHQIITIRTSHATVMWTKSC